MTREEYTEVTSYLKDIYQRINKAKEEIREFNYGQALKTLSDAYPTLRIKVDD